MGAVHPAHPQSWGTAAGGPLIHRRAGQTGSWGFGRAPGRESVWCVCVWKNCAKYQPGATPHGPWPLSASSHTSLRCGYSNSNNSRAGPEGSSPWFARGGGSCSPTPRVLGAWSPVRGGGHPRPSVQKEARGPAQGGPRVPGPPEMLRWVCPHRRACRPWTHVRIQAASRSLPLGFIHVSGADLHPLHAYSGGASTVCGPTPRSA